MKTILFQGDSITDCGRARDNSNLGLGYPHLVKAKLGFDRPGEFEFINRGISGNRIVDLYARIKADFINLDPDFLSILIGVNDVWHEFGSKNGVSAEKFERIYKMLIGEIREACPNVKILILEPFCLRGSATDRQLSDGTGLYPLFRGEVEKRAAAAKRVAEEMNCDFLPLQDKFDALCDTMPSDYWLFDGVHPTPVGHEMITREYLKHINI